MNSTEEHDEITNQMGSKRSFVEEHEGEGSDESENEGSRAPGEKRAGRRKINIEFIEDKSRRHITFSKRKAGIMKKAYELSTLTGTQVLLLVASETGHVYTFATPKLQPLITKPEGKNLIQSCLNAPDHPSPATHGRGGLYDGSGDPGDMYDDKKDKQHLAHMPGSHVPYGSAFAQAQAQVPFPSQYPTGMSGGLQGLPNMPITAGMGAGYGNQQSNQYAAQYAAARAQQAMAGQYASASQPGSYLPNPGAYGWPGKGLQQYPQAPMDKNSTQQ